MKTLLLKLFWDRIKRKKVPAKNIMKLRLINTCVEKTISDFVIKIFSYNKNIEITKMKTDSNPVGIESNKLKELEIKSIIKAIRKIKLSK